MEKKSKALAVYAILIVLYTLLVALGCSSYTGEVVEPEPTPLPEPKTFGVSTLEVDGLPGGWDKIITIHFNRKYEFIELYYAPERDSLSSLNYRVRRTHGQPSCEGWSTPARYEYNWFRAITTIEGVNADEYYWVKF